MKIGDTEPVYMAGQVVAQAKVAEFDSETATLIIPATRVVMAVRTSLAAPPEPEVPEASGNQHVMLGLENENPTSETAVVGGEQIEVEGQPQVAGDAAPTQPEATATTAEAPANTEGEVTPVENPTPPSGPNETPQPVAGQDSVSEPQ